MKIRTIAVLAASLAALGMFANGCQSGGVGDPCTPEDEYQQTFSGFTADEINLESRSFQCETRVCLVNRFRGRVSCPLGQAKAEVVDGKITPVEGGCRIPGTKDGIAPKVVGQCTDRRAADTVYCSCRCKGPDANAKYCDCPSGYECKEIDELKVGAVATGSSGQLQGGYCVKKGYDEDVSHDPKNCAGSNDECTVATCGNNPQLSRSRGKMITREGDSRRLPQFHGRQAETVVSELLAARGYTILAHNLRLGHHELDIVARRGAVITAFEVRFRGATSWQSSLGSIGLSKRRHLQAALRSLWARVRRDPTVERVKLEVAAVTFDNDSIHVEIVPAPLF